ncbi:MAG: FecR domain-containing protein [Prolixibacteraceae bacterium]|nr:FecR domain-containing protein [Prolixibacteraceae bacterium]
MKPNHNIEDEKWALLAMSIYDDDLKLTAEEKNKIAEELLSGPEEKNQLLKVVEKVDLYFDLKKYPAEEALEKVQNKIQKKSQSKITRFRKLFSNPLMRYAAAVLVAVLLSVAGYEMVSNKAELTKMLEISSADQVVKSFKLPDGTLVSLNSDTQLKYPKRFGKETREVTIEGEAFFEVKPNKNKPFIIHAGNAQIKVLGTSFNVSAYPRARLVEVIVETGKVQVSNKLNVTEQTDELILDPGDKGTLVYSSNALLKTTNQNPNFMAWKTHNLIFRATSLNEVISNLEKVYKVNIRLADPKLNGLLLTAHFNDYPLDFILKVIETTFQMETQKIDGQYILKAKS